MAFFLVLSALAALTLLMSIGYDRRERQFIFLGYVAHIFATFGMMVVMTYFYSGGDMALYHNTGAVLAGMVRDNPDLLIELLKLCVGFKPDVFSFIPAFQSSTGVMIGIGGLLYLILGGSFIASCLAVSGVAFVGQVWMYKGIREHIPVSLRNRAAFSCFLIPSVAFWSSGLLKEAVSLGGLGLAIFGVSGIVLKGYPTLGRSLALIIGGWGVGLIKAYILFPLAIAAGFWITTHRSRKKHGHVKFEVQQYLLGIGVGILLVVGLGELFPRFSFENLGKETAQLQEAYRTIDAGSSYGLGFEGAESIGDQLFFAPIALVSTLFRPFIFEAHNLMALINALETSTFLFFWLYLLKKVGVVRLFNHTTSTPVVLFSFIFVIVFAVAVGLAAPNLGTLSRYRIPMVPIHALFLSFSVPMTTKRRLQYG